VAEETIGVPITEAEVAAVLADVPNGKSSWAEKVGAERYRYARRLRGGNEDKRPEINRLTPVFADGAHSGNGGLVHQI
jgi:hypothetical protein